MVHTILFGATWEKNNFSYSVSSTKELVNFTQNQKLIENKYMYLNLIFLVYKTFLHMFSNYTCSINQNPGSDSLQNIFLKYRNKPTSSTSVSSSKYLFLKHKL